MTVDIIDEFELIQINEREANRLTLLALRLSSRSRTCRGGER